MAVLVERVGFLDGRDIEAPVLRKFLILGRYHRQRQIGRNAVQIYPGMPEDVR
jgi:hypothetical protein